MTHNAQATRRQYLADAVATASPAQLVTMLYDRLALDLLRAEESLRSGADASRHLLHAQDIVAELRASLDVDRWEGAPGLASLYGYLLRELVAANVQRDAERAASCRRLVEPLRDAWHGAAGTILGAGAA